MWFAVGLLAFLVVSLSIIVRLQQQVAAFSVTNAAATLHHSAPATPAAKPTPAPTLPAPASTPAPVATPSVQVAATQNCVPDTAYSLPSPLNLASSANGLTQVVDPAVYYQIYGNSSAQIHSQVQRCAPGPSATSSAGADFAAETSYNLVWQYSSTDNGTGLCNISNAKVGLHINMVLPQWQPTASATAGLAGSWQGFASGLLVHENGHVAIDEQYAGQLLNDLQDYPPAPCASIGAAIQAKLNADVAALNAANDAYDARTGHGVTQGAILP